MSAREVRRVALFGTESTGKSSLAEKLAGYFNEPWSVEYVRRYWDEHDGRIGADNLEAIARGQREGEDEAASRARRVVFHDTDLLTHVLWTDILFPGACLPWVRREAEARVGRIALYLLCAPDIPFVSDPQRVFADDAARAASARLWREALEARGLPFVEIKGTWSEREVSAIAAVQALLGAKSG
jgi:HTH-type transcriptional regulator, transcriptional repressor of NAD biosynthesis genes